MAFKKTEYFNATYGLYAYIIDYYSSGIKYELFRKEIHKNITKKIF